MTDKEFLDELKTRIMNAFNIPVELKFELVARMSFNQNIIIKIDPNSDVRGHRPHAHIFYGDKRIARIWLDTWNITDDTSKDFNKGNLEKLNLYIKNHKDKFIEIWNRNNNIIKL